MQKIKLGCEAQDAITCYTGVVVCISEWLNGCKRVTIQTKELHDGKPIESQTFDIEQLELVTEETVFTRTIDAAKRVAKSLTGGPHDQPSRNPAPSRRD